MITKRDLEVLENMAKADIFFEPEKRSFAKNQYDVFSYRRGKWYIRMYVPERIWVSFLIADVKGMGKLLGCKRFVALPKSRRNTVFERNFIQDFDSFDAAVAYIKMTS